MPVNVLNKFRIDFEDGARTQRPLPPPGNPYDARLSEDGSALFAATAQVTTITLGTSTATDDVTTLTITPETTLYGSAWAQNLAPVSLVFVTGETQTLAALAAGLVQAAVDAQTVASVADIANYQRVLNIVKVTATDPESDALVLTSSSPGSSFTFTFSSTGAATAVGVTTGAPSSVLEIGTVAVQGSVDATGYRTADRATDSPGPVLGVVMDGNKSAVMAAGSSVLKSIPRANDLHYRRWGTVTAYAESGVAVDAQVFYRSTVTGTEHSGAVTDTATTDTPEVLTLTPNPVENTAAYTVEVVARDFFTQAVLASGMLTMTSDGDATATEIVTGLTASLAEQAALAALTTPTGTATLILSQDAGVVFDLTVLTGNIDAEETAAAASDHRIYPGATFAQTTTAAGTCAIVVAHP
jgi:hypothetical protein